MYSLQYTTKLLHPPFLPAELYNPSSAYCDNFAKKLSQHLVALANVSVISHLNDLEKLIRLVGRPNNSTNIRSSTTNAIHIEFLMDNQTEREIRDFFRQLDVDGDGEINWVKDYLRRSKFGKAQNYQLARYQTLLNRFDSDGDHTITYDEFISSFQLQGYEFVANQKIQDNW